MEKFLDAIEHDKIVITLSLEEAKDLRYMLCLGFDSLVNDESFEKEFNNGKASEKTTERKELNLNLREQLGDIILKMTEEVGEYNARS